MEGRDKDRCFYPVFSASQNAKMVLQMVLRMEKPPSPARSNLDRMQSMVSALEVLPERVVATCSCLPGFQAPKSGSNSGRRKRGLSWAELQHSHGSGLGANVPAHGFHVIFMCHEILFFFTLFSTT